MVYGHVARTRLPAGRQEGFVSFVIIRAICYWFLWNLAEKVNTKKIGGELESALEPTPPFRLFLKPQYYQVRLKNHEDQQIRTL
jgi:hypothetical protein